MKNLKNLFYWHTRARTNSHLPKIICKMLFICPRGRKKKGIFCEEFEKLFLFSLHSEYPLPQNPFSCTKTSQLGFWTFPPNFTLTEVLFEQKLCQKVSEKYRTFPGKRQKNVAVAFVGKRSFGGVWKKFVWGLAVQDCKLQSGCVSGLCLGSAKLSLWVSSHDSDFKNS